MILSRRCSFCNHPNPEGAKFCNDCGSPLHLKPCSQCESINDQAAKTCAKCGAQFPVQSIASEAAANIPSPGHYARFGSTHRFAGRSSDLDAPSKPTLSAAKLAAAAQASFASKHGPGNRSSSAQALAPAVAAPAERERRSVPLEPTRPTFENPPPTVHAGSDGERIPESVLADEIEDALGRRPASETPETRDSGPEVAAPEVRSSAGDVISFHDAVRGATEMVPLTAAEPHSMSRVTRVAILPAIIVIAIGVSAYYIYGQSSHLGQGKGAQTVSTTPVDVNAADPPTRPITTNGVTAPSAPSAALGTGSVAATESPKDASPVESSTTDPTAPANPGEAGATRSDGDSSQTPSPHQPSPGEPHSQVSKNAPAARNELAAKQSPTNRPMRTHPATGAESVEPLLGDNRANVRPEAPRANACTEAVAALGLCSPNSTGESK